MDEATRQRLLKVLDELIEEADWSPAPGPEGHPEAKAFSGLVPAKQVVILVVKFPMPEASDSSFGYDGAANNVAFDGQTFAVVRLPFTQAERACAKAEKKDG